MGLTRTLIAGLALLFISLGQAAASISAGSGSIDFAGSIGGPKTTDEESCTGTQCGFVDEQSAAQAIAAAAGAKQTAKSTQHLHMGVGGSLPTAGPKPHTDEEPVLFTVIAPARTNGQLCVDEQNLIGALPTCKTLPTVPEPGTLMLLGIGLLGLAVARTRSRHLKGARVPL